MILSPEAAHALPGFVAGFAAACAVSFAATPIVRRYARRLRVVDRPEARRVNTRPVARGGGIAVAAAFILVTLVMLSLNGPAGLAFVRQPVEIGSGDLAALLVGGALAVVIGAVDDLFQIRARWQLLGQLFLACLAVSLGVVITAVNLPFARGGALHVEDGVAVALTVFWIVGMINSINFIDGLDGLSNGIGFIAATTLGIISVTPEINQPFVALFCFILAGALLGFLRWNFFPARIFAGTSGIVFLGYTLAVLSVLGTAKIAVAMLVLGIPIIDTFWIIVRRLLEGRSPFAPDRGHIHHRLLDLGLSHRNTVLLIYAICALLAVLSVSLSGTGALYAFMGLVLLSGLALFAITRLGGGGGAVDEDLSAASYEPEDATDSTDATARDATATPTTTPTITPTTTPTTPAQAPAPAAAEAEPPVRRGTPPASSGR